MAAPFPDAMIEALRRREYWYGQFAVADHGVVCSVKVTTPRGNGVLRVPVKGTMPRMVIWHYAQPIALVNPFGLVHRVKEEIPSMSNRIALLAALGLECEILTTMFSTTSYIRVGDRAGFIDLRVET